MKTDKREDSRIIVAAYYRGRKNWLHIFEEVDTANLRVVLDPSTYYGNRKTFNLKKGDVVEIQYAGDGYWEFYRLVRERRWWERFASYYHLIFD